MWRCLQRRTLLRHDCLALFDPSVDLSKRKLKLMADDDPSEHVSEGCCSGHEHSPHSPRGGREGPSGRGRGRGRRGGRGDDNELKRCFRCGEEGHPAWLCTSETVLEKHSEFAKSRPQVPSHRVAYIDTHCHCDYICESARVPSWGAFLTSNPLPHTCAGVITTLCDTTGLLSSLSQLDDLLANHPNVFFTFGLHPHNSRYWNERVESRLTELVFHPRCVGWGEIGLDTTSEKKGGSSEDEQCMCFLRQIELATTLCPDKPIQIHFRGDAEALISLLSGVAPTTKLHLHSWSVSDVGQTRAVMDRFPNAFFGLSAVAQQGRMRTTVEAIPLNRIVLESDGPYLLPSELQPPKSSRVMAPHNHPGNIPFVAAAVAAIKNVPIDTLLRSVAKNVQRLYGLAVIDGVAQQVPWHGDDDENAVGSPSGETHRT
jgi:TatD DNase family protein